MNPEKQRRETVNLRMPAADRGLIERAAQATGKSRSDFSLDAARRAATDALLDQTLFAADAQTYAAFLARLDAPAQASESLRKTLQTPLPWAADAEC